MKIPISKNWFGPEEFEAVQQPLREGWVVQGKHVRQLEEQFCRYTGADFAVACSSGTAALHIAAAALGVGPGDEVIVPAFTWVATANVIELLGGNVRFCDIDLATFNSNANQIENCLTPKTVGILPVHLFGLSAEMTEINSIAAKQGLWVIEDAACGLGAKLNSRSAGNMGTAGCFSFHPRKSITTGEGGILTTNSADLARHFDALRNHGAMPPSAKELGLTGHTSLLPEYSIPGFNYRLTDIQGALGAAQMQRLDWLLQERQRCANHYMSTLADIPWLRLPTLPQNSVHAWQSFVTLFSPEEPSLENVDWMTLERNRFMTELQNAGIATRQGTHAPAHLPYYKEKYNIRREDFPNAYLADKLTVALPLFPGMNELELDFVSNTIRTFHVSQRK
jgi:perosamine synthetase